MTSNNTAAKGRKTNQEKKNEDTKNKDKYLKIKFQTSDLSDEEKEELLFRVFDILLYE